MARPAVLIALLLVAGTAQVRAATTATLAQPPVVPSPDFANLPLATVSRVIDGDTVEIDVAGKRIECRLAGVDAAEMRNADSSVSADGGAAARFLEQLLKGENVYVAVAAGTRQEDAYGRTLAYLFRAPDGLFVNLEMIRQGYARVFHAVEFAHLEAFKSWESHARAAGKGIWKTPARAESEPGAIRTLLQPAPHPQDVPTAPVGDKLPVYITNSGTKYHAAGCTALRKSRTIIPLGDARKKYEPCRLCNPPR